VPKRLLILCVATTLGLAIAGCQAGGTNKSDSEAVASGNASTKTEPKVKPSIDEIRAVLQAHDKALNDKNLDAIMATFSTAPTTVVLGTGAGERWMGQQEIRGAYTEIVKDYDAGTLETNCATWKTGGSDNDGTMAWIAATCDCKDSLGGKPRTYTLNVSATVEKQDGAWKFVSLHMSNSPAPGPPTK
jgi:ketosteroid isomerase-like protein